MTNNYVLKQKKLNSEGCQEIAQEAVRAALSEVPRWDSSVEKYLALGTFLSDANEFIFSIYLMGDRPSDSIVFVETVVNRFTGDARVEIFPERWLDLKIPPRVLANASTITIDGEPEWRLTGRRDEQE